MPTDKIKRALTWLRRSLEITDLTTLPGTINGEIRPVIDAFGWERYIEADSATFAQVNATAASMGVVAADTTRLILNANVETTNAIIAVRLNFTMTVSGGQVVALQLPFEVPIGFAGLDVGLLRPILLGPGDNFNVSSAPASGIGESLIGRIRFIDLPVGEYLHSVG